MNPKTDLVIPAAQKDYIKLPHIVELVREFIDIETIHVIAPDPAEIACDGIALHADGDVLPYDRTRMVYRPNWMFQQMLKVFQDVTANDWFLVMDADIFPCREIPLWNDDGQPILYLGRDQHHGPYFTFNKKVLGFGKVYPWSFLSECTLYNKQIVRDMLAHCSLTLDEFWNKLVEETSQGCKMGDAELYGSYVFCEQQRVYEIRKLVAHLGGRYKSQRPWTDKEIEAEIKKVRAKKPEVDIMSLHSWEGG